MDEYAIVAAVVTGVLSALVGAAIGWVAAHRVDKQSARRLAYGRYLGALDGFLRVLRHRVQVVASGVREEAAVPLMPSGRDVGAAFGEITIMSGREIVTLVDELQAAVIDFEVWAFRAPTLTDPLGGNWSEVDARVRELRMRFIEVARRDAGDKPLGADFWKSSRGSDS